MHVFTYSYRTSLWHISLQLYTCNINLIYIQNLHKIQWISVCSLLFQQNPLTPIWPPHRVPHRNLDWAGLILFWLTADVVEGEEEMVGVGQLGREFDLDLLVEVRGLVVVGDRRVGLPGQLWTVRLPKDCLQQMESWLIIKNKRIPKDRLKQKKSVNNKVELHVILNQSTSDVPKYQLQ